MGGNQKEQEKEQEDENKVVIKIEVGLDKNIKIHSNIDKTETLIVLTAVQQMLSIQIDEAVEGTGLSIEEEDND